MQTFLPMYTNWYRNLSSLHSIIALSVNPSFSILDLEYNGWLLMLFEYLNIWTMKLFLANTRCQ